MSRSGSVFQSDFGAAFSPKRSTLALQRIGSLRMASMVNNEQVASAQQVTRLLQQTNAWCGLNGLMYTDGKVNWTPAPISLIPNVFNAASFEYATQVQPIISKLVDRISRDREFLREQLASVCQSDSFTKRVMELYEEVPSSVLTRGLQCGILRSDYMINNDNRPLQVEINTIASSFGYLSKKVGDYHRFMLERNKGRAELQAVIEETVGFTLKDKTLSKVTAQNVVENPSTVRLASVLAAAHAEFNNPDAVVLFIVQPGERNIADQRSFEAQLWNAHGVRAEFLTLKEVHQRGYVAPGPGGNCLCIRPAAGSAGTRLEDAEYVVSVAYYRAGYTPNDYPTEDEWSARRLIEHSSAVKCPNAGYQLAGTKAIQASLCLPGVLERFLTEQEAVKLRACFAAQYSLVALTDDTAQGAEYREATEAAVLAATADGGPWVLKPQREGGGNNFYGAELSAFLKKHANDPALSGYVLMQRIFPVPQKTAFLRAGALQILPSISELGVYGTYLAYGSDPLSGTAGRELINEYGGYLLRTKPEGVDEGGVASGYSVLNSVILD